MTMQTIDDPLQIFCDSEYGKYALSSPWVRSGWRYATDGRILVREPCDLPDTHDDKLRPKGWNLFDDFPECDVPVPCFDGRYEDRDCSWCHGTRHEPVVCHECDGDGECKCGCPVEHECARCEGIGTIPSGRQCSACLGDGRQPKNQLIAGSYFQARLMLKVGTLPGVKVAAEVHPDNGLAFVDSCGRQGRVMPLRKD